MDVHADVHTDVHMPGHRVDLQHGHCSEPDGIRAVKAGGAEALDESSACALTARSQPVDTMEKAGPSGPAWMRLVSVAIRRILPEAWSGRWAGWLRTPVQVCVYLDINTLIRRSGQSLRRGASGIVQANKGLRRCGYARGCRTDDSEFRVS